MTEKERIGEKKSSHKEKTEKEVDKAEPSYAKRDKEGKMDAMSKKLIQLL